MYHVRDRDDLHKELIRYMRTRSGKLRHLAVLQDFTRLYQHPALL